MIRVQQPGVGPSKIGEQGPESDYEEIGPPPGPKPGRPDPPPASVCDLCGTAEAMVRCLPCSNQIFCLACDDMYHRHPKRSTHTRKALILEHTDRPPLPPKGGDAVGPIAPPRRTSKKSSTPDSICMVPSALNLQGPSGNTIPIATLPRKNSAPMMGRPLPAPPPNEIPPFIRSQSLQQPPQVPSPSGSVTSSGLMRQLSSGSQPPITMHPIPQQFNPTGGLVPQPPQQPLIQSQQPHMVPQYNPMGQPIYPPHVPSPYHPGEAMNDWNQPYHEQVVFPPPQQTTVGSNHPQRFSRLNKSSSMHDLAHALAAQQPAHNEAVSWEDQHWTTTQSVIHAPPVHPSANFRRSTSSKSLHQDFFNANPMWSAAPHGGQFHPMMGAMQPPWGMMNHPNMSAMNRSMHDLHLVPPQAGPYPPPPGISPTSQRSKKSTKGRLTVKQASRSQSRNASRNSRRGRRGPSETSEETESDDDDFYTGESDADFVSLSSGSNPRKAPRISWTCDHCTYVNNPGVNVCVVCCRTSTLSMTTEPSRSKSGRRYASSEDEEDDSEEFDRKRSGKSKTSNGSRRKGTKGKATKSPRPRTPDDQSDLEQDVLDTYYAVRMGNPESGRMDREGAFDSSSETGSSVNNMKSKPNFKATPSKGILKKYSSNPQLAKLEQMEGFAGHDRGMSEMGAPRSKGGHAQRQHMKHQPEPQPQVVDINKYLKTQKHPRHEGHRHHPDDIWQDEKEVWLKQRDDNWSTAGRETLSPSKSLTTMGTENDYMSDVQSTYTDGTANYRPRAGQPGNGLDPYQPDPRQINSESSTSEDTVPRPMNGSMANNREIQGPPTHGRHLQGPTIPNGRHMRGPTTNVREIEGPGGIGSYLARQEFGSNEGQAPGDSGYVSHGSGAGGGYPKMQLPTQAPIESFTMSVDRGFLGRNPAGEKDANQYRSMDDISMATTQKSTGMELVRLLREAEKAGFKPEDLQCAVNHCGDMDPVEWLKDNWSNMIDTVVTLASNAGHEQPENRVGTLSVPEARDALRKHKGNVWASVTECYDELCAKGNFEKEDILNALTAHNGDFEDACQELNKLQLRPFLMRIWGQPEPAEVTSGSSGPEPLPQPNGQPELYRPGDILKNVNVPQVTDEIIEEEPKEAEQNPEEFAKGRQARRLLAEGKVPSYEKGELVVTLTTLYYDFDEALMAAQTTDTVAEAEKYLQQECELCTNVMKLREICKMIGCNHQCCQECAQNYFTVAIKDKSISDANCPFCSEPKYLNDDTKEDEASDYFAKLDLVLKKILAEEVHDLFQRKLRDRTLMKDPNFKWCYKCSSGFIANLNNKRLVCPDCRAMSCSKCLQPWESAHENISCEAFAEWKEANDPDNQARGLEKHMEEHGITCPSCKFRYTLSRGGCMHFTCTQCKFEFCIGCEKPFKMGVKCGKDTTCAKMGLHAHHPRNCLFYLRDKEHKDLQKLLKADKIEFKTHIPADLVEKKCFVQVQKETNAGLVDDACGEDSPQGLGGYCQIHYVEYLSGLVFRNNVEPVSILDIGEMKQVFTRANHFLPKQRPGEYEFQFKRRLADADLPDCLRIGEEPNIGYADDVSIWAALQLGWSNLDCFRGRGGAEDSLCQGRLAFWGDIGGMEESRLGSTLETGMNRLKTPPGLEPKPKMPLEHVRWGGEGGSGLAVPRRVHKSAGNLVDVIVNLIGFFVTLGDFQSHIQRFGSSVADVIGDVTLALAVGIQGFGYEQRVVVPRDVLEVGDTVGVILSKLFHTGSLLQWTSSLTLKVGLQWSLDVRLDFNHFYRSEIGAHFDEVTVQGI
eukprot:maker-scaffold21_size687808-snap-gene-5.36 protein:Tk09844 transcript:maker-scaffold21_size687808-snap-gene-5.36-mRNA-1 annotation:"ring finger protein 31"